MIAEIQIIASTVRPSKAIFANSFCAFIPSSMIRSALFNKTISICFLLSALWILSIRPLLSRFFREEDTWDFVDLRTLTISAVYLFRISLSFSDSDLADYPSDQKYHKHNNNDKDQTNTCDHC